MLPKLRGLFTGRCLRSVATGQRFGWFAGCGGITLAVGRGASKTCPAVWLALQTAVL